MNNFKILLTCLMIASGTNALANDKDNGGDECERQILTIRTELKKWMDDEGHQHLQFPQHISRYDYEENMPKAFSEVRVSCVSHEVKVNGGNKTCKNYVDNEKVKRMECNYLRFNALPEENQYIQIHHEYAGAAEIETNKGAQESQYFISNQLSAFMKKVLVTKLAIKPLKGIEVPSILIDNLEALQHPIYATNYEKDGPTKMEVLNKTCRYLKYSYADHTKIKKMPFKLAPEGVEGIKLTNKDGVLSEERIIFQYRINKNFSLFRGVRESMNYGRVTGFSKTEHINDHVVTKVYCK
jgi:hypothetical protein